MSENREIWFIEGSLAEKLAAPLRENYHLCRLSAKSQSAASSKPDTGCAANYGVVLADMRDGAPMLPASWNGSGSDYRVIGVVPASGLGSPKTSESQGAKASAAVFAFVSVTASREELKAAEREREQLNEIGIALSSQRDVRELLNLILAKAREITRADAGSLYLIEDEGEGR